MFRRAFTIVTVTALLLGASSADAGWPKITVRGPTITVRGPKITAKGPEVTVKKPAVTVKKPEVTVKKPKITAKKPEVNMGNTRENIERTVAKAVDDTEKAASKAVKDTGKTVEKAVADASNEVTRERESDGSANMDFTGATPGPVLGTHYKLEVGERGDRRGVPANMRADRRRVEGWQGRGDGPDHR